MFGWLQSASDACKKLKDSGFRKEFSAQFDKADAKLAAAFVVGVGGSAALLATMAGSWVPVAVVAGLQLVEENSLSWCATVKGSEFQEPCDRGFNATYEQQVQQGIDAPVSIGNMTATCAPESNASYPGVPGSSRKDDCEAAAKAGQAAAGLSLTAEEQTAGAVKFSHGDAHDYGAAMFFAGVSMTVGGGAAAALAHRAKQHWDKATSYQALAQ